MAQTDFYMRWVLVFARRDADGECYILQTQEGCFAWIGTQEKPLSKCFGKTEDKAVENLALYLYGEERKK